MALGEICMAILTINDGADGYYEYEYSVTEDTMESVREEARDRLAEAGDTASAVITWYCEDELYPFEGYFRVDTEIIEV